MQDGRLFLKDLHMLFKTFCLENSESLKLCATFQKNTY